MYALYDVFVHYDVFIHGFRTFSDIDFERIACGWDCFERQLPLLKTFEHEDNLGTSNKLRKGAG